MRWIALVVAGGIGCGSATTTAPAAQPLANTPAASTAADPIIDHLRAYRDDLCECKDRRCTRVVGKTIDTWRSKHADDIDKHRGTSAEQQELEHQMTTCKSNANTAAGADPVWTAMQRFKTEMCGCADAKDADCAKRVTDEMSTWASENAGNWEDTGPPTADETQLAQQLAECTTKAMMAGMQQPSPPSGGAQP
jgi:hypothetical protein|nr:hypothetical protein [Kofleriaceae bacterium]